MSNSQHTGPAPESNARPIRDALVAVATGTAAATGDVFFRSLVQHLASALDVRCAMLAELLPESDARVRTLAIWDGQGFAPTLEYDLPGTPCDDVVGREMCIYPRRVRELFPRDQALAEMSAESYFGVPLFDSGRRPLGLLAVVDDRPMEDDSAARSVLAVFAARAGAELERLRADSAFRQSEATQRALLEAIPDLIFRVGREGECRDHHGSSERSRCVPPGPSPGRRLADTLPPEAVPMCMQNIAAALDTGRVHQFEYSLASGGERRQYEARLVPREDSDVVAIVRDVTAERRLEERIQRSQRLESLVALAGGVAHDFNNLLSGILGFSELALRSLPPDSLARAYLFRIEAAAERAADLTRQMLAYSGSGKFVLEPIALNQTVEETLLPLRAMTKTTAELLLDLAPGLPPILADQAQLRQLLLALLTNAAEAIGPRLDGLITVRTRLTRVPAGSDDLQAGDHVALEVLDNGCGMDAATLERVFDPFFSTKFAGRGLGLAAALGIARGHHGLLRARSEPGRGASFELMLPATEATCEVAGSRAGAAPAGQARRGSGTVLVVDDEEAVRMVAAESLSANGFTVLTASDGRQALAILAERGGEIRLVLLDMIMPDLDGAATYRELRQTRPNIPVLLSSGYAEQDAFERFRMGGLSGFLQKPYRLGDLIEKVHAILAKGD